MSVVFYSKGFKRWLARVHDSFTRWTEADIIYFRKAIGLAGLKNVTERISLKAEFNCMVADLDNKGLHGFKITLEQSEKGTDYLLSKSLKKNGQRRKGNKLGQLELDILANRPVHYLVGLISANPYIPGQYFLPLYKAVDIHGAYFIYTGATYSMVEVHECGIAGEFSRTKVPLKLAD